ncbi:RICIN domain-containing protein [Actinomadura sp. 6N118]|uniref:RICIN domain-containing protein n=1 Tax=Actinomadura sp. 6N118 TaxID=3375151 RepID=UPI0037B5052D
MTAVATPASAAPGPFYWIVNEGNGKALLPFKHSKEPNTNIVMQSKTNEGAMHWKIGGSGTLRKLENRHSHLCARAGANDTFVLQHDCGFDGTTWIVSDRDRMWAGLPVTFENLNRHTCLTANGVVARTATCVGTSTQQWRLEHVPGT